MTKTREMASSTFGQESKTIAHKGLSEIKITSYQRMPAVVLMDSPQLYGVGSDGPDRPWQVVVDHLVPDRWRWICQAWTNGRC